MSPDSAAALQVVVIDDALAEARQLLVGQGHHEVA
jgi:hypothetical protein